MTYHYVPGRIRRAMKLRGLTVEETAGHLQISPHYLARILDGSLSVSAWVAVRLEALFELDSVKILNEQLQEELRHARQHYGVRA